jgi:hypothetical protein
MLLLVEKHTRLLVVLNNADVVCKRPEWYCISGSSSEPLWSEDKINENPKDLGVRS